ncbi:MAG TPA: hypothetical protein VGI79_09865 [Caulobacteraceae bacterium]|jgi:hypothetical protein
MIRPVAPLVLLASLIGASAMAAPSPVEQAFGNTIVSTYPDGRHGELWLKPGGTYTAKGRRGDPSNGHWSVKGDQLCLKQSRPIPTPFHYCTAVPRGGLGSTWSAKAVSGEPIRVKLVKGRG